MTSFSSAGSSVRRSSFSAHASTGRMPIAWVRPASIAWSGFSRVRVRASVVEIAATWVAWFHTARSRSSMVSEVDWNICSIAKPVARLAEKVMPRRLIALARSSITRGPRSSGELATRITRADRAGSSPMTFASWPTVTFGLSAVSRMRSATSGSTGNSSRSCCSALRMSVRTESASCILRPSRIARRRRTRRRLPGGSAGAAR